MNSSMNWKHALKNKKLEITPEAEKDIFTIATNIQMQLNHEAAMKTVGEFRQQLGTLLEHADSGRAGVCDETREVVLRGMPYIAVYETRDDSITVVRILHGAQDTSTA